MQPLISRDLWQWIETRLGNKAAARDEPVIEKFVERTTRLSTVAALTSVVNDTAHFLRVQARN